MPLDGVRRQSGARHQRDFFVLAAQADAAPAGPAGAGRRGREEWGGQDLGSEVPERCAGLSLTLK